MRSDEKLSENFARWEFACNGKERKGSAWCCGGSAPVSMRLIKALQELRDMVGGINIVCGFRCNKYNEYKEQSEHSQHCLGTAADIRVSGLSPRELAEQCQKVEAFANGGIGVYPKDNFVHVDVREHRARWTG